MPAGTTFATKTLDRIITISQVYALFTGAPLWQAAVPRVLRGYTRFQDSDNFENFVSSSMANDGSQAFFSCWFKEMTQSNIDVYPARIIGELVFPINGQASNDLNAQTDAVINFAAKLLDDTQYLAGEIAPHKIGWKMLEIDVTKKQGILVFDFGNYGAEGIVFPDP